MVVVLELSCQLGDPVHVEIVARHPDEAGHSIQKIVVMNVEVVVITLEIVHCTAEDVDGNYYLFFNLFSC